MRGPLIRRNCLALSRRLRAAAGIGAFGIGAAGIGAVGIRLFLQGEKILADISGPV